jgi:hypothetical protein
MTLRRTVSGLQSMHLFFRVDRVIYCEGGKQLDLQAVISGAGDADTLDTLFWSSIAELYCNDDKKRHYKSVGSKTLLKSMATDIDRYQIKSVVICMDRDHDCYCSASQCNCIVFTHGYSWENDVVSTHTTTEICKTFLGSSEEGVRAMASITLFLNNFAVELLPWCEIDIALYQKKNASLFKKSKPLGNLIAPYNPPKVRDDEFRKQLLELGYKRGPKVAVRLDASGALNNTFGKLLARATHLVARDTLKKVNKNIDLDYDTFMRLAIKETATAIKCGALAELKNHFSKYKAVF